VVQNSDDTSCYDASHAVQAQWGIDLIPESLTQCQSTRIFWRSSDLQGCVIIFHFTILPITYLSILLYSTPSFVGIIPGGNSFQIPAGKTDDESASGHGIGFNYTANIRGGTQLLLVASDNRGNGTGGIVPFTVANGPNDDESCLNDQSPSSTPGTPAGGSYPTSTDGSGVSGGSNGSRSGGQSNNGGQSNSGGSSNGNRNNIGAIVGGVVGGVALLVSLLLLFFFRRRQKSPREQQANPYLLTGYEGDKSADAREGTPPRPNELRFFETTRSRTLDLLREERTRGLRPVNIIRHDDAGPSEGIQEEPEIIELPPAYNTINPTEPAQVKGGNFMERSNP
jgi:hypothetical protein